jgi:hypothetical protein
LKFKKINQHLEQTPQYEKLNKRNSISLPDITASVCHVALNDTIKSTASTPNKPLKKNAHTSTPTKSHLKKKNISIIFEDREKENPNYTFSQKLEKTFCSEISLYQSAKKEKSVKIPKVECREIAIQCNKMDEDLVMSENVDKTDYWKLMAFKRFACIGESLAENKKVNHLINCLL